MPDDAEGTGEGDALDSDQGQENGEKQNPDAAEHEITVDGKKVKVSLAELKRGYGHMKVATQRLQEAAGIREKNKQFSGIFDSIRTNPENLFELGASLGVDIKSMAAKVVLEEMRRESLSPEQLELEELRKDKQTRESEKQREQRERQEREATQNEVANLERTGESYAQFFESKGMSPNLAFQERMLTTLVASYDRPGGPMTMDEAFARTQKWEEKQKASRWENLSDDDLAKLPPEVRSRLRKADVAGMRRLGTASRAPAQPTQAPTVPDTPVSVSEAMDGIRQQLLKRNTR